MNEEVTKVSKQALRDLRQCAWEAEDPQELVELVVEFVNLWLAEQCPEGRCPGVGRCPDDFPAT